MNDAWHILEQYLKGHAKTEHHEYASTPYDITGNADGKRQRSKILNKIQQWLDLK